jgi:YgiT-type zinc finger domain-containing protein
MSLQCPECGKPTEFTRKDETIEYKGQQKTISTLGWWCVSCGECVLGGEGLSERAKAFIDFKAEVDKT